MREGQDAHRRNLDEVGGKNERSSPLGPLRISTTFESHERRAKWSEIVLAIAAACGVNKRRS